MRRKSVRPVAVLLLALHGLIAVSGNAGLHEISGCAHHDMAFCSDEHAILGCGDHCDQPATDHATTSFVRASSCLTDSHSCPICQWWSSCGRLILVTGGVVCVGLQPQTGIVGEIGILLPRPDHRESFPRGPPPVLLLA